jgi:hypothetical protein
MSPYQSNLSSVSAALERVGDELANMRVVKLRGVNLHVGRAGKVLRDSIYRVEPLLPQLVKLPDFNEAILEKLGDYTTILLDAHRRCSPPVEPREAQLAMARRARRFLELFRADTQPLVTRGMISEKALRSNRGNGYQNLATDLLSLTMVLRAAWPKIHGRCSVTIDELREAESLIKPLAEAGRPSKTPVRDARDLRARALTAAVRDYEQLRLGLSYIRRNVGDAEKLAPSLFRRPTQKVSAVRSPLAASSPLAATSEGV